MIATFVMTWERFELPIDIWIEKAKIESRISEKDNRINNWFGWMYDSLCITADEDNWASVLVSDYPEDKQVNDWTRADFVELNPSAEIHLPWNREVWALNRPFVCGQAWDVIKVVAR